MDIIEIIATIVGLIFYFWLNSRRANQPDSVPSEEVPPTPKPTPKKPARQAKRRERSYTNPKNTQEKVTLQELLKQHAEPRRALEETNEAHIPKYQSYEEQFDENGMPKSFISKKDAGGSRSQIKGTSPEMMNRLSKSLQNPVSLRDAFILKEVLDRKHF